MDTKKKLNRAQTDNKFAGVCGGIAEYFGIDSTIIRLIWVLAVVFAGVGLLAYIIAAIVMPNGPAADQPQPAADNGEYVPYTDVNN